MMKKGTYSVLFIFSFLVMIFGALCLKPGTADAAVAKGTISSVTNVSAGVKLTWEKDSTKDGYYIYRKAGSATSYSQIKKITSASTVSYTDTNVSNGTKYVYKVVSYKGSKKSTTSAIKTIYRLSTPTIKTLTFEDVGDFHVISNKNSKASGFQIKYSPYSSFSSAKTVTVTGTTLKKTVANLTAGKTYYIKIRCYKKANNTKYYSGYTAAKSFTTKKSYTAYTTHIYTTLHTKPDSSSTSTQVYYMQKVTLYANEKTSTSGVWKKLKCNDKIYYAWIEKGAEKFTKTKNPYDYSDASLTKFQKEIIETAIAVMKKGNIEYAHGQSTGTLNANGKYGYDCSGFATYVLNKVMQKYVPTYRLTSELEELGTPSVLINPGYSSEFSSYKVCGTKLDISKLQPGDLVFMNFTKNEARSYPWNHVGIYLGKGDFIHITPTFQTVLIQPLIDVYEREFAMAIRYIPKSVTPINKECTLKSGLSIYSDRTCKTEFKITQLKAGDKVTLLWIHTNRGSVRYGTDKYGFVLDPEDKL